MVGYCGINCLECRAYKGTVSGDQAELEHVAQKFGKGAHEALDWVCLGCGPHNTEFLSRYCFDCGIRACAIARQVSNCAACDQFESCDRIHSFFPTESPALARSMEWLRAACLRNRARAGQRQG